MYSEKTKSKRFLNKKKYAKITKRVHSYKVYPSTYSVEILNYFNLELQLKDTQSEKKKLLHLLSELRGSKIVTTSVLEFRKTENDDKT